MIRLWQSELEELKAISEEEHCDGRDCEQCPLWFFDNSDMGCPEIAKKGCNVFEAHFPRG